MDEDAKQPAMSDADIQARIAAEVAKVQSNAEDRIAAAHADADARVEAVQAHAREQIAAHQASVQAGPSAEAVSLGESTHPLLASPHVMPAAARSMVTSPDTDPDPASRR